MKNYYIPPFKTTMILSVFFASASLVVIEQYDILINVRVLNIKRDVSSELMSGVKYPDSTSKY